MRVIPGEGGGAQALDLGHLGVQVHPGASRQQVFQCSPVKASLAQLAASARQAASRSPK